MHACHNNGVENIIMTMWGDDGSECSRYSVLPVLYAIRRIYDGVTDMDTIRREFYEITGESFDALVDLELPNCVLDNVRESPSAISKSLLFSDPLFGYLDVTVKDGASKDFAANSKLLREHGKKSVSYGYLFETNAALCDVMEIRYDLGARTRKAYKAGDREALAALLPDYAECIERIKELHKCFSYQWHRENKPHGFEVQDHRYGALMLRLDACISRIGAYLNGEIDSLLELEDELLPMADAMHLAFAWKNKPGHVDHPTYSRHLYVMTVNAH